MDTFTFIPDSKTKGFQVQVPDGTLTSKEMQDSISQHYKEFLDSDVEKSKNAGDTFAKVIIALGSIAVSYFLGKKIVKNDDLVSLEELEKMEPHERINYLTGLSEDQLNELTSHESMTKIIQIFFDSIIDGNYSIEEIETLKKQTKILCDLLKVNFPE